MLVINPFKARSLDDTKVFPTGLYLSLQQPNTVRNSAFQVS